MQPKHASNRDEALTVGEAASFFGVSTDTIRRWERGGRLQGFRTLTGHRRFYRSELEAALGRANR